MEKFLSISYFSRAEIFTTFYQQKKLVFPFLFLFSLSGFVLFVFFFPHC